MLSCTTTKGEQNYTTRETCRVCRSRILTPLFSLGERRFCTFKHLVKFWNKVNWNGPKHTVLNSQCWEWTGWTNPDGYGRIYVCGGAVQAHRFSWLISKGPTGDLCVLHKCDNPTCVNPEHLFLGDRVDNNKDREAKGRGARMKGKDHPRAKLTESNVREIRQRFETDGAKRLSIEFGVTSVMIRYIVKRILWSHID